MNKKLLGVGLGGLLLGVLLVIGLRMMFVKSDDTHYHANFAVYINGEREPFKSFTYYEEIAACTSAFATNPKGRTHMHDNVNDVIHVHDKRVTYQDFFENLGWSIGADFVHTDAKLYANSDTEKVQYMLNGKLVDRVDSLVIGDKDTLLVSYGAPDTDLQTQYKSIAQTAAAVDAKKDPASCSGLNGSDENSLKNRFKRAVGMSTN